jgi:hypothetical protein
VSVTFWIENMASEKDFELIDDYLAGRLAENDRVAFEKKIEADQALKSEIEFQKQLVEGLKKARVAELKSMLNSVPVSSTSTGGNTLMKTAGWIAATVVVGTIVYYLSLGQKEQSKESPTANVTEQENATPAPEPNQPTNESSAATPTEEAEESSVSEKPVVVKKQKKSTGKTAPVEPKIEVFDPTVEDDEDSSEPDKEMLADEYPEASASTKSNTIVVSIETANRKYNFHYKLVNDNLTLYGPFERELYEIMEFISDNKRTAFLLYKNTFYYIKETDKTTELAPVKDPALINKLRKLQ